jgi:ankyrin repeat protein
MKGGRRSLEEKVRQKCDGEQDPISLDDITDSRFAIRLLEDGHYFCYDARSLKGWFDTGSRINPATNKNFSNANIEKIKKKFRKLGIDGEMENKLFHAVKRSNSRDLEFLQETLPHMPYLVNIKDTYNGGGNLLYYAVRPHKIHYQVEDENTEDIIKLLIKVGTDVNGKDNDGWTPLFIAVKHNLLKNCKLLIDAGADVNSVSNYGHIALSQIAPRNMFGKTVSVLKLLLENGSDVNRRSNFGSTPFASFIWYIREEGYIYDINTRYEDLVLSCVKLYIDAGADLNEVYTHREGIFSPLSISFFFKNYRTARILLENGADPNFSVNHESPLAYESFTNNILAVKYLLEFGADLDKTFNGETALYIAAKLNHLEIAELLLSRGANFHKKTDGKTPFDVAKTQKMRNLIVKYSGHPDQLAIYI